MEVDPPQLSGSQPDIASTMAVTPLNPLKRSNSAPMINILVAASSSSPPTSCVSAQPTTQSVPTTAVTSMFSTSFPRHFERIRRYSTSSTCLNSPVTPVKMAPQLDRIKREETSNIKDREAAHENKVQSHMQLSLSWESLHLEDPIEQPMQMEPRRPKSFQEPLHIFTSPYPFASSPSPTRIGKQCFSPSLQQPVQRGLGGNLTPSPSPSPTRKTFVRRSMSPISLRPSPLGTLKRKMDSGGESMEYHSSPKRLHMTYSPVAAQDKNSAAAAVTASSSSIQHPLMQSMSSSDGESVTSTHNGMLPPSPLHPMENSTLTTNHSTSCRSPLTFTSASSSVSSSTHHNHGSPNLLHPLDNNNSSQPMQMDSQPLLHNHTVSSNFPSGGGNFPLASGSGSGDFPRYHHHHHHHHEQQHHNQYSNSVTPRIVPTRNSTAESPRVSLTMPPSASVFGTFRPVVRDSIDSMSAMSAGGTDSETSDMAETTDLSETSDANNSASLIHTPSPTLFNPTAAKTQSS